MTKKIVSSLICVFFALIFGSCISTKTYTENSQVALADTTSEQPAPNNNAKVQIPPEEFITIKGKGGVYFEGIDDETFKKTRSIKVTPGEHILKIGVEKGNEYFSGRITTDESTLKKIYAVSGMNMYIDVQIIERGASTVTGFGNYQKTTTIMKIGLVYRVDSTQRLGTTKRVLKNPEEIEVKECPKKIDILTEFPTDRKFIIVGNLKTEIKATLFTYSNLSDEIVYKSFLNEAYTNGIDALIDICPHSNAASYAKGFSGLGIKYVE